MKHEIIPGMIMQSIYSLRGEKVMLDSDLAALNGVATKVLNQAVKRNAARFPAERAVKVNIAIMRAFGERTRLACWRWRPRHRELPPHRGDPVCSFRLKKSFSASRRKEHAGRVRSPSQ